MSFILSNLHRFSLFFPLLLTSFLCILIYFRINLAPILGRTFSILLWTNTAHASSLDQTSDDNMRRLKLCMSLGKSRHRHEAFTQLSATCKISLLDQIHCIRDFVAPQP